jgi:hypothetical protein
MDKGVDYSNGMFESGKAPYPIYSCKTGKLIE